MMNQILKLIIALSIFFIGYFIEKAINIHTTCIKITSHACNKGSVANLFSSGHGDGSKITFSVPVPANAGEIE